jgi:hypothetical protein
MPRKVMPAEALVDLRRRLSAFPPRGHERRRIIQETAARYGMAAPTLSRALQDQAKPRALRRADCGTPRILPQATLEQYCERIAALTLRTSNRKGRHFSTAEAIRVLEESGLETPEGFVQAPRALLKTPTINRSLKAWGSDWTTTRR